MQADLYRAAEAAAGSAEAFGPGEVIAVEGSAMDRLLIVREGSCCMIEVRAVSHGTLRLGATGALKAMQSLLMCNQSAFSIESTQRRQGAFGRPASS